MARPTKKNPLGKQKSPVTGDTEKNKEIIRKLEEAFLLDCPIDEACFYADISVDSYYVILKKNPKLSERFDRCRQQPTFKARKCLVDEAQINPEIALKYLERKRKSEFATRSEFSWPNWWPIEMTLAEQLKQAINSRK